jgi:hypothetical protein
MQPRVMLASFICTAMQPQDGATKGTAACGRQQEDRSPSHTARLPHHIVNAVCQASQLAATAAAAAVCLLGCCTLSLAVLCPADYV